MAPGTLILLRHGQSTWNEQDLFTGWTDVPLSGKGQSEAYEVGQMLLQSSMLPDIVYTSLLRRSINTANVALDAAGRSWIPVKRDWRLNERHYGSLQGKCKADVSRELGDEQVHIWRRSYAVRPPRQSDQDYKSQSRDDRYCDIKTPRSESLEDVYHRLKPYWESEIQSDLRDGKTVIVVAHGNSLRALIKMLDGLGDDKITEVNIPTGIPVLYELDNDLRPVQKAGRRLDTDSPVYC